MAKPVKRCRLDDGRIVQYDACGKNKVFRKDLDKEFKYLGQGYALTADGSIQRRSEHLHFFRCVH